MKAALALIVIYVGTFLVAIQGSSPGLVQAAGQAPSNKPTSATNASSVDPAKDADIRALLELVGARDMVQDSVKLSAEQYREKLFPTLPNSARGQAFLEAVISGYEKKFDTEQVIEQLVVIYDKHYSEDEIKGMLQFYGTPLGQKVAAEMPKISREIQGATRAATWKAVKDALEQARQQDPEVGQNARLSSSVPRRFQPNRAQQ
jgi:uncharacterized protein